ncbi:MAG: helix-turn-helix transcriptional regulator [Chitinispirillaceae bacterium]|nr:helix-turn-helix transcriptional regulator [Chitinispirillaceae bacterium]
MDWLLFASIILSAVTAASVVLALITLNLADPVSEDRRALTAFLLVLLMNQAGGFILYTASSQQAFREFTSSASLLSRLFSLAVLTIQYAVFVSTAFLVPGIFRTGRTRRGAIAIAVTAALLLLLRAFALVPLMVVYVAETFIILPGVYGIWILSLFRAEKKDPLAVFLACALVPAGILERAAVDPLWPVPELARDVLSGLPLAMTVVLMYSVLLAYRSMSMIRTHARGDPILPDFGRYDLSPREKEIAGLLFLGYANKEIAQKLSISYGTVKNHAYSLYTKLGIRSRFELQKFR